MVPKPALPYMQTIRMMSRSADYFKRLALAPEVFGKNIDRVKHDMPQGYYYC